MEPLFTPLSLAEIDELADFLDGLPSPDAMSLERLDGFLCALFVGPDIVMPSEYWPYIVGGDMEEPVPAFGTAAQANEIMQLVARHWNTIARAFNTEEIYAPLLFADETGGPRGNEWAMGFLNGVALRDSSWQVLLDHKEHAAAIIPIIALAGEHEAEHKVQFESLLSVDRERLLEMMTVGLREIYDFFAPMRAKSARSGEPIMRREPKIGRNEPCPCGSGKKYKQCCVARVH